MQRRTDTTQFVALHTPPPVGPLVKKLAYYATRAVLLGQVELHRLHVGVLPAAFLRFPSRAEQDDRLGPVTVPLRPPGLLRELRHPVGAPTWITQRT